MVGEDSCELWLGLCLEVPGPRKQRTKKVVWARDRLPPWNLETLVDQSLDDLSLPASSLCFLFLYFSWFSKTRWPMFERWSASTMYIAALLSFRPQVYKGLFSLYQELPYNWDTWMNCGSHGSYLLGKLVHIYIYISVHVYLSLRATSDSYNLRTF